MIAIEKGDVLGLAGAVHAAVESGLLGLVAEGDGITAHDAAQALSLDAGAVRRVLDVLAGARLTVSVGDRFALDPELAEMHRSFPGGLASTAMLFSTTAAYLHSGTAAVAMDGDVRARAEAYRAAVGGLGAMFTRAAASFAAAFTSSVEPALPASPRVLDVGCGAGVWGLATAAALPGARLTGLDLPGVTDVFRAAAAERGLADRVATIEGDMHEVPLVTSDVVLVANVLRLEPAERARALVRRLAGAVAPAGALVIVDALAGGTPERDLARAVYTLNLALRTRGATVHTQAQLASWLEEAGLPRVSALDFGVWPGAVAALVARRGIPAARRPVAVVVSR